MNKAQSYGSVPGPDPTLKQSIEPVGSMTVAIVPGQMRQTCMMAFNTYPAISFRGSPQNVVMHNAWMLGCTGFTKEWWPAGKKDAAAGAAVAKRSMKQPKLPFGPKRPKAETEQPLLAGTSSFVAA